MIGAFFLLLLCCCIKITTRAYEFEADHDYYYYLVWEGRFGPDALTWSHCGTRREYLWYGLQQASGYHIVTGAGLLFFSAIGRPSPVAFVRFLPSLRTRDLTLTDL